jgi:hypothetical protein
MRAMHDAVRRIAFLVPLALLAIACPRRAAPPMPSRSAIRFDEVTASAGIVTPPAAIPPRPLDLLQTIGAGCAFVDIDNDGNLDIVLLDPKPTLYKGDAKGHFVDVSAAYGLSALRGTFLGIATGDFDGDGFVDLYLCAYRGGALLHNRFGKRLVEITRAAGIAPQPFGTSAAFFDADGDGRLDLYVAGYIRFGPDTPRLCREAGILTACNVRQYAPERGRLYRNLGAGRFVDATVALGADTVSGRGLGVAVAPLHDDSRPSLAIANDELPGDLLERGPKGRLVNRGVEAGVSHDRDGRVHGGMGLDWGDFDNDGRLDLIVTTFARELKTLYRNDGGALFSEVSAQTGLTAPTPYVSFGVKWLDFDNDGFLDLVIASGHVQDNVADVIPGATYRQPTLFLRNIDGRRFEDISARLSPGATEPQVGRGLATGDFDNDGRKDVLLTDREGPPRLLHNTSRAGHWIGVDLGPEGLGASVTLTVGGHTRAAVCQSAGSYLSASDPRIVFGLGERTEPGVLRVRWPSKREVTLRGLSPDRYHRVR